MGKYNDFDPSKVNGHHEKRQHERFRIHVRVAIRLSNGDVAWAQGVDISMGGIFIEYASSAEVGHEFEMLFDLPFQKDFKRVFVKASVVRSTIIGGKDVFGIAFVFNEFAKDTKKVLENYIRFREKQKASGY